MNRYILEGILSLIFSVVSGFVFIPLLKKIKAKQTILGYVKEHKDKNGTPTMGGLFFILSSSLAFLIFGGYKGRIAVVSLSIGIAFMLVGFIDDFVKIKFKRNEGLKPYQKIIFQLAVALSAGGFCYVNNITVFYLPFSDIKIDFSVFSIFIVALIFIATTNCVNLTDGLDGLVGSISIVYLIFISIIISLQISLFDYDYLIKEEYENIIALTFSLIGGIAGFLVFNVNKARVFMGDTGSLALGGFIASISIFSSNGLFIPIIGITFVITGISVIIQVLHYKRTKKRVFLMAPLHHHFQLKGYTETQIVFVYALITCVLGAVSVLSYV